MWMVASNKTFTPAYPSSTLRYASVKAGVECGQCSLPRSVKRRSRTLLRRSARNHQELLQDGRGFCLRPARQGISRFEHIVGIAA